MIFQNYFQASEPPSKSLVSCFKYSSDKNGSYQLHCHSYYEICYILKGERYEFYNGKKYRVGAGSLFFIPPLMVHGNENITDVEDIILQFSTSFASRFSTVVKPEMKLGLSGSQPFIELPENDPVRGIMHGLSENSDSFNALYAQLGYSDVQRSAVIEYRRNSLVLSLIASLLDDERAVISEEISNYSKQIKLDKVINRILDSPAEIPDMSTAAQMSGMSYYNFSRLFKEATDMNYSEYCNAVRVRYAEEMLMKTELSAAEIAARVGIDTPSYFARLFRQFNSCSPAEYRRMYKNT